MSVANQTLPVVLPALFWSVSVPCNTHRSLAFWGADWGVDSCRSCGHCSPRFSLTSSSIPNPFQRRPGQSPFDRGSHALPPRPSLVLRYRALVSESRALPQTCSLRPSYSRNFQQPQCLGPDRFRRHGLRISILSRVSLAEFRFRPSGGSTCPNDSLPSSLTGFTLLESTMTSLVCICAYRPRVGVTGSSV